MALGDRIDHHEPDIVALRGVLAAWIAETDEEKH